MRKVVIGSEALSGGGLTRARLRWNYRRILPDVYVSGTAPPSLLERTVGGWMWSRRNGIIAGRAAAALHGAQWVDDATPVELIGKFSHPPSGIIVRNERIDSDEITQVDGLLVTSPQRTALDLARYLPLSSAVIHLDALARVSGVNSVDVLTLGQRYPGAHGIRSAVTALSWMDGGAETPHETILRLLLRDWWLDVPRTQIKVVDGDFEAILDVGYDEPRVGLDYEGKHFAETHDIVRGRCVQRAELAERAASVERAGWRYQYVLWETSVGEVLARVRTAFERSGYRPTVNPDRRLRQG